MYSKTAVDKAVQASNRAGRRIGAREREAIHRLLKGRQSTDEPARSGSDRFLASITKLGFNVSTADRLLGIGRTSIYRIARGGEVPEVVQRLLDMYERHGIPEEHRP